MFPAATISVEGKPFVPYWVWGLMLEDAAKLRPWGINTVFSSEADIDRAAKLGLKVFWPGPIGPRKVKGLGRPDRKGENALTSAEFFEKVRATAARYKDHPALLGWFMCDEPRGKITPEFMARMRRAIKEADPAHVAWLNMGVPSNLWMPALSERLADKLEYAKVGDVLCGDPYPIPFHPVDSVARITDCFTRASQGKPVFIVPQFFGGVGGSIASPTREEETAMVYLALIHGARGFCFYSRRPTSTPLWQSMLRAGKEIRALVPTLSSAEPAGISEQRPDGYACGIHCLPRRRDGRLYLITANAECRDVRAEFVVPGLRPGTRVEVLFENRTIKAADGGFSDTFEPYARHVYQAPAPRL